MKLIISIVSSLLIMNCVSNGMEIIDDNASLQEKVLYNCDILFRITEQVWKNDRYAYMYVGRTITALSCINTKFNHYYSTEKNQQKIIRDIARNNYQSDASAALILKFHTITEKIKYFIDIAKNKDRCLSQEDLQDKWYLKSIDGYFQPLVHIAIQHDNLAVAEQIINHLDSDITCTQLSELARVVYWKIKSTENADLLLLLQNFHTELKKKVLVRRHKAGI